MRKSLSLVAGVAVLGALALMPVGAGAGVAGPGGGSKVAPGSVYKGTFLDGADMEYRFRIKTFESGSAGNFSLKCAGVTRVRIEIRNNKAGLEFGADKVMVKGAVEFRGKGRVVGEITKIVTPGSTCDAPGSLEGTIQDV